MPSSERNIFERLPLEIRLHIYSYLLSDENVVVVKPDGTVRPQYQTALFTVNRKISSESLAYFCAENGFVVIRTNMGTFVSECAYQIPVIVDDSVKRSYHYILSANIIKGCAANQAELGGFCQAIFASRHLSNFVRLLNTEPPDFSGRGRNLAVFLRYRTHPDFFTPKRRVVDDVANGFNGIRNTGFAREKGHLKITITGDLDMKTAKEIKDSSDPPTPTMADILHRAEQAKESADDFSAIDNYVAARFEYQMVTRIICTAKHIYRNEFEDHDLFVDHMCLLFNSFTNMSLLYTKWGEYQSALLAARMSLRLGRWSAGGNSLSPAQVAKLWFRVGCTLVDVGADTEAVIMLHTAVYNTPDDIQMQAKLQETMAREDARWEAQKEARERRMRGYSLPRTDNAAARGDKVTSKPHSFWLKSMSNRIRMTKPARLDVPLDWLKVKARGTKKWVKGLKGRL
ncbi:hypothetical protein MMC34_006983 [Xylographa carneopallida]|nr:hypothetical protein [Xylographa carneopallida]